MNLNYFIRPTVSNSTFNRLINHLETDLWDGEENIEFVKLDNNEYYTAIDMLGFAKEDITISQVDDLVSVTATRKDHKLLADATIEHKVKLPKLLDKKSLFAKLENGYLFLFASQGGEEQTTIAIE